MAARLFQGASPCADTISCFAPGWPLAYRALPAHLRRAYGHSKYYTLAVMASGALGSFLGAVTAGKNSVQLIGDVFEVGTTRRRPRDSPGAASINTRCGLETACDKLALRVCMQRGAKLSPYRQQLSDNRVDMDESFERRRAMLMERKAAKHLAGDGGRVERQQEGGDWPPRSF